MNKKTIRAILSFVIVGSFLSVIGLLYFFDVPKDNTRYLDIMLGALIVLVKEVCHFNYGTSQGSEDKMEIIKNGG